MIDKTTYWFDVADYDLATAKDLVQSKRWIYVAFMCHQTLEKGLKAYWCATQPTDPPYTHNLLTLISGVNLTHELSSEQKLFIQAMMPLNIEARYPDYKNAIAKSLNAERSLEIIAKTEEFYLWIKNKLQK